MSKNLNGSARWPLLAIACLGVPLGLGVSCLDESGALDARRLVSAPIVNLFVGSLATGALCVAKTVQELTRSRVRH